MTRRIAVRNPDAVQSGQGRANGLGVRLGRCHRAFDVRRFVADDDAAGVRNGIKRFGVHNAGRAQSRVFAVAVPGEKIGNNAQAAKERVHSHFGRAQGRLGDFGLGKGLGGGFLLGRGKGVGRKYQTRNSAGAIFIKRFVGGLEGLPYFSKVNRGFGKHVRILRALPGEEKGDPADAAAGVGEKPNVVGAFKGALAVR